MAQTNRRTGSPDGAEGALVLGGVALIAGVVGAVYAAVQLSASLDDRTLPTNGFFETFFGVLGGTVPWTPSTSLVLGGEVALLLLLLVPTLVWWRRRKRRPTADRAARHMGHGRDLQAQSRHGVQQTAQRLGVSGEPGVPVGRAVAGGTPVYGSWEDTHIDIWGPRTGKTTSRAIPAILAAPGTVLVTSNKRDVVDATRGPRQSAGQVWVFDPQGIVGERPAWWWNPLDAITDEVRAAEMADLWMAYSRAADAKTDAFFDSAAQDLLAGLILAAAEDGRPVTQVYLWLTNPTDDEPAFLLDQRYPLTAATVRAHVNAPDKQRGGVYGTALKAASWLTNREALRWCTGDPQDGRPRFDVRAFVAQGGTLYMLSKEGRGTAGPLVTSMTVAVANAAEDLAKVSPGGRLGVPMLAVLDEAANVCRWRELPNLYSHYGSRGIIPMTILQSWSQGVEVWGRDGMRKLWSAANIRVYGGGVSEAEFLREMSELVGDFEVVSTSVNRGKDGRSTSRQYRETRVLSVADLASMPKGRAVVFPSGARPVLIRTQPWMTGPHAEAVQASIAAYDPGAATTITQARQSADAVAAQEAVR
ncbi:type IV secretory system conjugative DNA transfer family protein [Luteipulveratus flavus]|uniref:TraM recognition domain-containing protein n=1 Tax=Luteipulveratus flavus TaxID=3031728 RepID=A0ABT6C3S0_9MICO|nr:type IV secretory system conjugative DNA transfer family protein [Luteipulveratus sp. YIM 133296]MDF8263510.1 TraM recognition domain-containing protein [Luteipulveratus sp. YIM 133296]